MRSGSDDSFYSGYSCDLSGLLSVLDRELYSDCQTGKEGGLPVLCGGFFVQNGLPGLLFDLSYDEYQAHGGGRRVLESGGGSFVPDRCGR